MSTNLLSETSIPEFSPYITTPRNSACRVIDATRLMVEILGGLEHAGSEFSSSSYSSKLKIDWEMALVMRYQRESDGLYHPACVISFEPHEDGLRVVQIQWSKDKSTGFRFGSSFNSSAFFLRLIEDSFLKKWIPVTAVRFPEGMEGTAYGSGSIGRYDIFRTALEGLNRKYFSPNRIV